MANPAWFNFSTYMANKLAQLKSADADTYGTWDAQKLSDAFADAGFVGQEGAFAHFNQYGNSAAENVSPNSNFIPSQYYIFKAASYYNKAVADVTAEEAASIGTAIREAGMSAWQHYIDYGTAEKINPSNNFDTAKYLEAKAAALNAAAVDGKTDWDADSVAAAFKEAGMNALEHAILYSADDTEGEAAKAFGDDGKVIDAYKVDDKASGDTAGSTFTLTTAIDNLTGTSGDDTFIGDGQTASAADQLNGGEGTDTLQLFGVATNNDMPTTKSIENIYLNKTNGGLDVSAQSDIKAVEVDGNAAGQTYKLTTDQSITFENMDYTGISTVAGNTPTTLNVAVDKFGSKAANPAATLAFTGTALTTVNLTAQNNASYFTLTNNPGKLATLNVAGDAAVNITETLAALKTVDASTNTGGVKLDVSGVTKDLTFTGGSGNDSIIFGAGTFDAKDTIDMGAGDEDKVTLAETAALSAGQYTALNAVKNAEVLGVNGSGMEVDAAKLTNGITSFEIGKDAAGATLNNVASGAKITIDNSNGHANSVAINNVAGNNTATLTITNDSGAAQTMANLTVLNVPTVNITSTGESGSSNTITAFMENASKISIGGDRDLTITGALSDGVAREVDASSFTGALTVTGGNAADTIKGGSGNDVLGGGVIDTTNVSAGSDPTDEVQVLKVTAAATVNGVVTVTLPGNHTFDVDIDTTAANTQALQATAIATAIGTQDYVTVGDDGNGNLTLTYKGDLAAQNLANATVAIKSGATSFAAACDDNDAAHVDGAAASAAVTAATDVLTGGDGENYFVLDVTTALTTAGVNTVTTKITDFTNGSDKMVVNGFVAGNFEKVTTAFDDLAALVAAAEAGTHVLTAAGDVMVGTVGSTVYVVAANANANVGNIVELTGVALADIDANDFAAAVA